MVLGALTYLFIHVFPPQFVTLLYQKLNLNPEGENTSLLYFYLLFKRQEEIFGPSLRQQPQSQAAFPGTKPKASPVSGMLTRALLALIRG